MSTKTIKMETPGQQAERARGEAVAHAETLDAHRARIGRPPVVVSRVLADGAITGDRDAVAQLTQRLVFWWLGVCDRAGFLGPVIEAWGISPDDEREAVAASVAEELRRMFSAIALQNSLTAALELLTAVQAIEPHTVSTARPDVAAEVKRRVTALARVAAATAQKRLDVAVAELVAHAEAQLDDSQRGALAQERARRVVEDEAQQISDRLGGRSPNAGWVPDPDAGEKFTTAADLVAAEQRHAESRKRDAKRFAELEAQLNSQGGTAR